MGQARNRGSFEERKAQAIANGRVRVKRAGRDVFGMPEMYGLFASILGRNRIKVK